MNKISQELINHIVKFIPTFAGITTSPVVGIMISLIEDYFGIKSDDKDATQKIQNDPDHDIKMKQVEDDYNLALIQAGIKFFDQDNARQFALDSQAKGMTKWLMPTVILLLVIWVLVYSFLYFFGYVGYNGYIVTTLVLCFLMVFKFCFG